LTVPPELLWPKCVRAMADTHRHSVVIVEDSQDARESLAMLLELSGHHVVSVANGAEALTLIRAGSVRPCVIILDLIMPHMDGLAFLDDLRVGSPEHARIPVIVFTGHEGLRKAAVSKGCMMALLKPAKPEDLLSLVDNHCPPVAASA
jgi:CheY-like chemotaxis protein